MDQKIFYVLAGLLVIYFAISVYNKKKGRRRRSRNFMEGQKLKDRQPGSRDQRDEENS